MSTDRFKQKRITNISGGTLDFPWVPWPYNGVQLANNGTATVRGDFEASLSPADQKAYNYALEQRYIRVETLPALDPDEFCQEEVTYTVDFPDGNYTASTGAQADIFSTSHRPMGKMKVVGAEFHALGIPPTPGGAGWNPAMTRAIALFNGATQVSEWRDIAPTGPNVVSLGDIVQLANINPTGAILTTGSAMTVRITAGMTGLGATGSIRVRCVPML